MKSIIQPTGWCIVMNTNDMDIGAGGLGFDSPIVKPDRVSAITIVTAATYLRSLKLGAEMSPAPYSCSPPSEGATEDIASSSQT